MVKITSFDSRETVATGPAAAQRPFDSPIGAGIGALGRARRHSEDLHDRATAIQSIAELRTESLADAAAIEQAAPAGGAGVEAAVTAAFEANVERRAAVLSPRAGRYFSERAGVLGEDFKALSAAFEIGARADADVVALSAAIDASANAIRSDPTQYQAARADLLGVLEGAEATMPAAAVAELRRDMELDTAVAALQGAIDDDPAVALDALHSGDYDERLTPAAKNTLIGQAERELEKRQREARLAVASQQAAYASGFADYEAFVRAGNAPDGSYSDDEIIARLDGDDAAELIARRNRAEAFGAKYAQVESATPAELGVMAAELRALAETPANFRQERQDIGLFTGAVSARIADDFADYEAFLLGGGTPDGRFSDVELRGELDPAEAESLIARRDRAVDLGAKFAAIPNATPAQLAATVGELRAAVATPENFRDVNESLGLFTDAVAARIADDFADYEAFLFGGGAPTGQFADAELRAELAPIAADNLIARRNRAEAFGAKLAALPDAGPAQVASMVSDLRQAMATPGTFRAESEESRVFAAALEERQRRIAADPAGYSMVSNPAVAQAWADADGLAAAGGPAAVAARQLAVDLGLAEQDRLGVLPSIRQRLPESVVTRLTETYRATTGQARAGLVAQMQIEYGDHFPAVARQLADAGLPGTLPVLASMTERRQATAAATVAELMSFTSAELREPLDDKLASDVDTEVNKALAEFTATMSLPSQTPTVNRFADEVRRLGYFYARQGLSARDAAAQAAKQIVNDSYAYVDTNGRNYRIPRGRNAVLVAEGADRFLENVAGRGPFNVPAADPLMDPAEINQIFAERLATDGFWVTNGDETGLTLFHEFGFAVQDAGGRFITVSWDALRRGGVLRGEENRATAAGDLFAPGLPPGELP